MNETFASEIYKDLKATIKFLKVLVVLLVLVIATMSIYHDYQWSRFDSVIIDTGEGPANYVGGENSGGIFNGTNSGTSEEGR